MHTYIYHYQCCYCQVKGYRPWGFAGTHLRRSNVAKYRSDVAVCSSMDQVTESSPFSFPPGGGLSAALRVTLRVGIRLCSERRLPG